MKLTHLAIPFLFVAACAQQNPNQNYNAAGAPSSLGRDQASSPSSRSRSTASSSAAAQSSTYRSDLNAGSRTSARDSRYANSGNPGYSGSSNAQATGSSFNDSRTSLATGPDASASDSRYSNASVSGRAGSSKSSTASSNDNAGSEKGAAQSTIPSKSGSAKISIAGTWSGVSNGEKIVLKIGAAGSASLTNSGGANSGDWSPSQSPGRYSFSFDGRRGDFVLLDSRTATLTMMGSSIELHR